MRNRTDDSIRKRQERSALCGRRLTGLPAPLPPSEPTVGRQMGIHMHKNDFIRPDAEPSQTPSPLRQRQL